MTYSIADPNLLDRLAARELTRSLALQHSPAMLTNTDGAMNLTRALKYQDAANDARAPYPFETVILERRGFIRKMLAWVGVL
jgi:hypothetical protein